MNNTTPAGGLRIRARWLAPGVIALACLGAASAPQAPTAQDQAAVLKQSLAQNQAALKQYSWIETTVISLKGEVKKQEQKQCFYGADGKVQKTPLPGQGQPAQQEQQAAGGRRGGRLKQAIVEKKVDEMQDYMEKAAALVHEYVPPDPQKIQAAQSAGNVSMQPGQGATILAMKNYLKPGDSLAIGIDPAAKAMRSYNVSSYLDKPEDAIILAVTFATLADGTSYPQQTVLDVKAKQIQVKITNSGYKKAGS